MAAGFRLPELDRRVVFALVAIAVAFPIFVKFRFPEVPSPIVRKIYDKVESLPAGSKVLLALDYDPGGEAELHPMARSFVRHCAERKLRIYFITLWAPGPQMVQDMVKQVLVGEFPEYSYGRDYMELGYKPGNEAVITVILNDLKKLFNTDGRGANIDDVEMMQGVRNLRAFDLILSVSAGYPGTKEWVQFAGDPGGIPVAAGMTAVQAPLNFPYYPRQLLGLLGGVKAAAEYEALLIDGYPKYADPKYLFEALPRMGPQTWAHLIIIFLILLGNVTTLLARRAEKRR